MTRRKEISEKSLELNVCAEFLQYIRSWPGCARALWFGLTQAQERQDGIDEYIRNVGGGLALMLQFKAPWYSSSADLYRFSINEEQHDALEQLSSIRGDSVYYVFPLYNKWHKADSHAPDLSQDTWLVPIASIPSSTLVGSSPPSPTTHRVDVERSASGIRFTAHSPEVTGVGINAKQFFEQQSLGDQRLGDQMKDGVAGIPSDLLREWLSGLASSNAPVRFRGLNALFVPQG